MTSPRLRRDCDATAIGYRRCVFSDLFALHTAQQATIEIERHGLLPDAIIGAPLTLVSFNDAGAYVDLGPVWEGPPGLISGLWIADGLLDLLDVLLWLEPGEPAQLELINYRQGWTGTFSHLLARQLQLKHT